MDRAAKEQDQEKRARFYMMAEKMLQISATAFGKVHYSGKREHVMQLLKKAKEERELAVSLAEISNAPSILSSTTTFTTRTPGQEKAVGLDRFERAEIQATLKVPQTEVKVGEAIDLEIEIVNAGKEVAQLVKLEQFVPSGFELAEKPEAYTVEDGNMNMKGKWLTPLKTEEVRLVLRAKLGGHFVLRPRILFLDEKSKLRTYEPETVNLVVQETEDRSFQPASPMLDFLSRAFVEDYMAKRLSVDHAGWRSLTDIVDSLKIPKSQVYGEARYGRTFGKPLEALVKSGLIEYRIFPKERGRGGHVMKVRVCYEREPVKRLVDKIAVGAPPEK